MICQLVKIKCSPSSLPGSVTQLGTGTVLLFSHPAEAAQLRDKQKVKTQFQTTSTHSYILALFSWVFFFLTPRSASNAFPVGLCLCNPQSALMHWPLVHIFLHIRISTSKSLEFHKDSFFFETSNGCLPLKLLLCVFFFFCLFCMKLCFFVLLNWLKEKRQTCALCTLSPHCWALFFSSSKFRKALCSCRKGGQVQQLLKLTT